MSIPHKAFLAMLAEKQQILRDNHLIDTTENMREDLQESHCGSMRVDEPLKGRGYPYNEKTFKPHMMYDPKTGKGYKANTYKDHLRMDKMGYTHEKPKVKEEVEQVDEWWSKQANPQSKGWKSATVKMNFSTYNSAGEGPNRFKKGDKLFYHPVKLGKGDPVVVATPDVKKAGKYFAVHPDRLGLKGFVSATGSLKDHVENPEYDPELGEMNIGEETIDEKEITYLSKKRNKRHSARDMRRAPDGSPTDGYYKKKGGKFAHRSTSRTGLKYTAQGRRRDINPKYGDLQRRYEEVEEAKSKDIVKGLGDSDGPFTVVAIRNKKVIKQETTKMRNMLPAIVKTMRKDIGPGGTIAIEDKKGTIRGTFREEVYLDEFELNEKFEFQFADKEKAMAFSRKVVYDKIASSSSVYDTNKVTVFGPHQAGVGSPTRAHQQIAKAMKKFGGKLLSTNEGPRMKKVFKEDIDMINEDDVERREIELFTSNHAQIYRQRIQPIIKNLARKKAKGTYDDKLAIKAWTYAVNDGIKAYNKEFGSSIKLSKAEKDKAAEYLLKHFEDE